MACDLSPSSKHPRLSSEGTHPNGVDRISYLPDSVLCHILSFLPTEDAVATSILSKRWVELWTQVPVLVFRSSDDYPAVDCYSGSSFVNFVFNVLLMSTAQSIRKFTLDRNFYWKVDQKYIRTWISAVVRRNVQELTLNFRRLTPDVDLPGCVFGCKTLVSLKLCNNIFVDVPATIHLPCLRFLQLMGVNYANEDSSRRLFSGCPVLQDLTVERFYAEDDNIGVLDISSTSVKRITVVGCACPCSGDVNPRCKLQIKAPLLERIDLKGTERYWDFLIEDTSNLAEANIVVYDNWSNEHQFFRLLKEIAHVRFLYLFPHTIWSVCPPKAKFPAFHNLVLLDIHCCCEYWHGLMALLGYSDNLEELVYRNVPWHERKCDRALRGNAPKCVSMRLKSLNFRNIYTNHCDWRVLRYVLENAKFLKQMKIGVSFCLKKRRRLLRNLLKYPRASTACEIGFFLESSKEEIRL